MDGCVRLLAAVRSRCIAFADVAIDKADGTVRVGVVVVVAVVVVLPTVVVLEGRVGGSRLRNRDK